MRAPAPAPARWAEIGEARFPIHLGAGVLDRLGELWAERAAGSSVMLVSDGNIAGLARRARAALQEGGFRVISATVPPGEGSKSLAQVERLSRLAAEAGLRRSDAVAALGGGVVGDLVGFVAASYQRGVRLLQVPTTLLAMVDSAIGGKTGVDLPEGKNYVGAIWQPELVVMDTDALATLSPRELACGFAEIVKYGLLEGPELFERVERVARAARPARRAGGPHPPLHRPQAGGGGGRRAGPGGAGLPQPRAHRRARHRGRGGLPLPPRRGHLARPPRGAAAVGGRGGPRPVLETPRGGDPRAARPAHAPRSRRAHLGHPGGDGARQEVRGRRPQHGHDRSARGRAPADEPAAGTRSRPRSRSCADDRGPGAHRPAPRAQPQHAGAPPLRSTTAP